MVAKNQHGHDGPGGRGADPGPRFVLYDRYARADLPGGRELVARPGFEGGAAVWEGPAACEQHESVQFFPTWGDALDYLWDRAGGGARAEAG